MIKYIYYIIMSLFATSIIYSQDTTSTNNIQNDTNKTINNDYLPLTKSPTKAVLYSLTFPGLGQIYNKQYWKSAVFIGTAGGLWYRIISNHIEYKDFQKRLNSMENKETYEAQVLKSKREMAVDNRDMSALYLLGIYVLSMVDAYSGSHLFDFNANSNISYSIDPSFDFTGNPYIKIGFVYRY